MARTTLPTITPGTFGRASWANAVKGNDEDHEDRIVLLEGGPGGDPGDVDGPASATDNAIVRFNGTTGKEVQNATPLVEDDGRISTLTDPTGPQDATTKAYVDALVATVAAGEADAAQTSFLVSGGQVTWVSAYTFLVSAATYYIGGTLYQSPQQTIALDAADGALDRIDVIAVNTASTVVKLTGTPASTPAEPDVDPGTELKLAIVSVPAASSAPVGASNTDLYLENAGSPGEFNWTSSGSGWTLGSTTVPRTGTTDLEATAITSGAYIQGAKGTGTLDPADFATLVFHLRSKAAWGNGRTLSLRWQNAGAQVGQAVTVGNGSYGFDSSLTASYQQIAIPMVNFAIPGGTLVNQLRLTRAGSGSIGFYLDDMVLQAQTTSGGGGGGGLTQAQADALYAPLGPAYATHTGTLTADRLIIGNGTADVEALGSAGTTTQVLYGNAAGPPSFGALPTRLAQISITIDGQGSPITTGVKGFQSVPQACTITGARVLSTDAAVTSGSIVVDVWKDTYANYPPTVADTITASAKPTLSSATKSNDVTLTGWTTALAAGDVVGFKVDSVSTVTKVRVELTVSVP